MAKRAAGIPRPAAVISRLWPALGHSLWKAPHWANDVQNAVPTSDVLAGIGL